MNSFRAKLITEILGYGLIVGAIVGAILYYAFPTYYTNWYLGVLTFFLILEPLILVFVESTSRTSTSKSTLGKYMLTKVAKMVLSLIFIVTYILIVKENILGFIISFMTLYLLFLGIETMLFSRIEKRKKEKKENE